MKAFVCAIMFGLLADAGIHGALANTPSNTCSSDSCAGTESSLPQTQQPSPERLTQLQQRDPFALTAEQKRQQEAEAKRQQAEAKRRRAEEAQRQQQAKEERRRQAEQQAREEQRRREAQQAEERRPREEAKRQCYAKCPMFDFSGRCQDDCAIKFLTLPFSLPPR